MSEECVCVHLCVFSKVFFLTYHSFIHPLTGFHLETMDTVDAAAGNTNRQRNTPFYSLT